MGRRRNGRKKPTAMKKPDNVAASGSGDTAETKNVIEKTVNDVQVSDNVHVDGSVPKVSKAEPGKMEKISSDKFKTDRATENQEENEKDSKASVSQLNKSSLLFFDVVEKIANTLKSGSESNLLFIFEKIRSISEDDVKLQTLFEVINTVLEDLDGANLDYMRYYHQHLKDKILPKELRSIFVSTDSIESSFILLGQGEFGIVMKGNLKISSTSKIPVAIKEVTEERYQSVLMEEAQVMCQLDHKNILKLLAITDVLGSINLVLEYVDLCDLVDVLLETKIHLTDFDMCAVIHDVATGMEYLANKQYVHRDLTCKNVFVNSNKECKIGDFGLCKYVGNSNGAYEDPKIRIYGVHVAPEVTKENKYTKQSDVWAMGAFIWHLYFLRISAGVDSYRIKVEVDHLWGTFLFTNKLPQVRNCPADIHNYVWKVILHRNPLKRPGFEEIAKKISTIVPDPA